MMVGSLLLLAAMALPQSVPAGEAPARSGFRPSAIASAHATARITVISGVKFGEGYPAMSASALRRSTHLTEYDGQEVAAELLEFQ